MSNDEQLLDLRRRVEILEDAIPNVYDELRGIRSELANINTSVALARRAECAQPGLCVPLQARVTALEGWQVQMEAWRNQAIGVSAVAKGAWVLIGSGITAVGAWIINHFPWGIVNHSK